ncbi:phosphatase PAP2 family protein [Luteitalea sp. TBR-22]|uniref:phosphatase PAP2 family protein n=1 Tax=Luteitalea sp. TBR-22 TaxID=2802971 RepID=UPI001EF7053A|nr:phosphatase PAP2 family protein [Luteitalea sp. TBR-22]
MTRLVVGLLASLLLGSPAMAQAPQTALTPGAFQPAVASADAAHASAAPMPSFASLFRDLRQDVKHLPSVETAIILGVGGAASLAAHPEDTDLTRRASSVPAVDTAFDGGAALGSGMVQGGAALATYMIGRAAHDQRLAMVGADLVRAQLLTAAMTQGLKLAVGRTRPDGSSYSFPSGHSSATFATATVLQRHYGWKAGVPSYGLAAYVAASRLSENRHYLSDVLFGAALGVVSGRAVTVGHGASTFALTPIAVPKGAGLGLTLVGAQ